MKRHLALVAHSCHHRVSVRGGTKQTTIASANELSYAFLTHLPTDECGGIHRTVPGNP